MLNSKTSGITIDEPPIQIPFKINKKVQCTVVNKGIRIEILFFELGHFSEGLMFVTIGKKGIFGLSLHKKKF